MIALPDGRVLYWNGLEGSENVDQSGRQPARPGVAERPGSGARPAGRDAGVHDAVTGDRRGREQREGQRAVDRRPARDGRRPGPPRRRPGRQHVGALGGPEHRPNTSPNDHDWNDLDLFCSDLAGMADGRVLIAGGIDWYNEPDLMARHRRRPGRRRFVELGGLRTTRIFDPATNSFSEAADMHHPRWYPTLVELPDGKFLAASGVTKLIKSTQLSQRPPHRDLRPGRQHLDRELRRAAVGELPAVHRPAPPDAQRQGPLRRRRRGVGAERAGRRRGALGPPAALRPGHARPGRSPAPPRSACPATSPTRSCCRSSPPTTREPC